MPMLVLYADAYPFELVVEVFISFVNPRPDLLLYVTVVVVSFISSVCKYKFKSIHIQPEDWFKGQKASRSEREDLQETPRKHEIWRNENVIEEVKAY